MDIDQVGVPESVATKLTVPEKVTNININRLRTCIKNGSDTMGGASSLIKNGSTIMLEFADVLKESKNIQVGDVVERYLRNDDIVLFNRQPSLHKGSMMAYRVRLMPFNTFRLNMSVTLPLNADCDGDELNVHVLQDEEAQTEAKILMSVPQQILSPQANKPCIGFVQDAIIGSWLLTNDNVVISRQFAKKLIATIMYEKSCIADKKTYTGKEIYSVLFPPNLNYRHSKTIMANLCILHYY